MTREEVSIVLESLSYDLWAELSDRQRDALDIAIEAMKERPQSQEDKKTKKCPNCGSDLYEHCYMCCYEGEKVMRNESDHL